MHRLNSAQLSKTRGAFEPNTQNVSLQSQKNPYLYQNFVFVSKSVQSPRTQNSVGFAKLWKKEGRIFPAITVV